MTTCIIEPAVTTSHEAQSALRPLFRADWRDVLFVHYAMDPAILQPHVPFELDLFDGQAYVSLVAFTQDRLRPALGGPLGAVGAAFMWPVRRHAFLNLRTYVRHDARPGICFLAEWIPNRLSLVGGPAMYGLPFRIAKTTYAPTDRQVFAADGAWHATAQPHADPHTAPANSLDAFLVERYLAYTFKRRAHRRFAIAHAPWPLHRADVRIVDDSLLRRTAPWFESARFAIAHISDGVDNVAIGPPERITLRHPAAPATSFTSWAPLALLVAAAVSTKRLLPAWAFMWLLAAAIFLGCKWATWWDDRRALRGHWARSIGYFFGWGGMDAKAFLDRRSTPKRVHAPDWIWATLRLAAGVALFACTLLQIDSIGNFAAGWLGMAAVILFLHFGLLDLTALAWQARGIRAPTIMDKPWRARTLGEFWGRRWNVAFSQLVRRYVLIPLLRRGVGITTAMAVVFLVSGLVHDAVISLPAGAGFGLPTAYFLIQAGGVAIEKSRAGRRHLRGAPARIFTWALLVLPVPLLFHHWFAERVIAPMLRALASLF